MKILILDIYRDTDYRISKDTSGGYGTGNDFGDNFVAKFLKRTLKKTHDWPPLFAAYTFSVLKKKGHEVSFLKNIPNNLEIFDLFIVVSSIVCCETEIELIKTLKKANKKIFAIGPFATNQPKEYTNAGATVILGEPEFYFLNKENYLDDLNKEVVEVEFKDNLDDLPYPAWNEMIENKKNVSKLFGNYNSVPLIGTRGCPYSCFKYCVYPLQQGRKVRQRDPKLIVDEMSYWSKKNIKMFIFRDPVFSINRKHTIDFCNELINRKIEVKFIIETHLRILDTELIKLLKKAGLKGVKVGVESSNPKVLKDANRFTIEKDSQLEKIKELESNNIQVSSMFILGFPSDDDNTINETIDYAVKINTTYAQFSVWTPYPGTPVFNSYKEKITTKKYEEFDQYRLVYNHEKFDKNEIRKYLSSAYKKYYLRFSWITKYIKSFY